MAELQIGKAYYFGTGIRANKEKGLEYLQSAAAHGNEHAANLLQVIQHQQTVGAANCVASLIAQLGRIFSGAGAETSPTPKPADGSEISQRNTGKETGYGSAGLTLFVDNSIHFDYNFLYQRIFSGIIFTECRA